MKKRILKKRERRNIEISIRKLIENGIWHRLDYMSFQNGPDSIVIRPNLIPRVEARRAMKKYFKALVGKGIRSDEGTVYFSEDPDPLDHTLWRSQITQSSSLIAPKIQSDNEIRN